MRRIKKMRRRRGNNFSRFLQIENQRTVDNYFDNLPDDIQKYIFRYFRRDELFILAAVSKKWHRMIFAQYSKSAYGKMLRFEAFATKPIETAIKRLKEIQKQLHYDIFSYVRSHPIHWPYIYVATILFLASIMGIGYYLITGHDIAADIHSLNPAPKTGLRSYFRFAAHSENIILLTVTLIVSYILYAQFRVYQHRQQIISPAIHAVVTNFWKEESKILTQFIYVVFFNQYPPLLQNPTMTVAELQQALSGDISQLEQIIFQFRKSVDSLLFFPYQKVKLDNFYTDNSKFKYYIQSKLKFWNELNAKEERNIIELDQKSSADISYHKV